MKLNLKAVKPVACLFAPILFTACKKNDAVNAAKAVTCTLSAVMDSSTYSETNYSIFRDEQGRIVSITQTYGGNTTSQRNFMYTDNRITVINNNIYGIEVDTLYLNSGNLIYAKQTFDNNSSANDTIRLYYNSNNELSAYIPNSYLHYLCSWQNGDLTVMAGSSDTQRYAYNDKPFAEEDAIAIREVLLFGRPLYKTAHLTTSRKIQPIGYPEQGYTYNYEFDSSGKVTKVTWVNNGNFQRQYKFGYECH